MLLNNWNLSNKEISVHLSQVDAVDGGQACADSTAWLQQTICSQGYRAVGRWA